MAKMYIQEYEKLAKDHQGNIVPVGLEPAVSSQQITFTVSTTSVAFDGRTKFVRVSCDAAARLKFGSAPVATGADMIVAANTPEYWGVTPGLKIAAYDGVS